MFKVAISDSRIVKVENDQVTFRYRKPHSPRERTMILDALEFIRRFLQHVLPSGLMKVRYYGFLHSSCSIPWAEVKARIEMTYGFALASPEAEPVVTTPITCRCCGGALRYLGALLPFGGRASSIIRKPAMAPSG